MKARIAAEEPDAIMVEIRLSGTLGELRKLRAQLADAWPSFELRLILDRAIARAEKHFTGDEEVNR